MSIKLKIKAKSLATEARFIRKEERTLKSHARHAREAETRIMFNRSRNSLHFHRTQIVRREARRTHLARAFIAGHTYASVETPVRPEKRLGQNDAASIYKMLQRYSRRYVRERDVIAWLAGEAVLKDGVWRCVETDAA